MSTTTVERFSAAGKAWIALLAIVVAAGVVAWGYQLLNGLAVTGMDNVFSWGLYIMLFVFFGGLSAGALIVASVPTFMRTERFEWLSTLGVLVSLASIVVAGLLIIPDIARPGGLYQFVTSPDPRSPMVWDFAIVVVYGLFTAGYLWLLTRRTLAASGSALAFGVEDTQSGRDRDRKLTYWAAAIAIPFGVTLASIEGWIFSLQIGRGDWFNPLVAPMFVMKGLVSGLAVILLAAMVADRFTSFEFPRDQVSALGKILGVLIAIQIVYLLAAERLPGAWASNFEFWSITSSFLVGNTIYFWLWTVVGGILPLALLVLPSIRERVAAVFAASAFALVGNLFEGINLVFTGYTLNIDAAPGVSTGTSYVGTGSNIWTTVGSYTPTAVELVISLGVIALGVLLFTLGFRYLPVQPSAAGPGSSDGGPVADGGGTVVENTDERGR